jgi:hypothetical protein
MAEAPSFYNAEHNAQRRRQAAALQEMRARMVRPCRRLSLRAGATLQQTAKRGPSQRSG